MIAAAPISGSKSIPIGPPIRVGAVIRSAPCPIATPAATAAIAASGDIVVTPARY